MGLGGFFSGGAFGGEGGNTAFKDVMSGGGYSQSKAAEAAGRLSAAFNERMDTLQSEFGAISEDYLAQFQELSKNFDPMELTKEYDALYEAVIQPMERDFSENVLPAIRQSYSGGGYGSALFSGGRESTEAKARSDLSMNKALLRFQGRETGIARNFQEYDLRRGDLGLQYGMETEPIQSAMNVEGQKYGAESDAVAAQSAAGQSWGNLGPRIVGSIFGGMGGNMQAPAVGSQGSQRSGGSINLGAGKYGYNSSTGGYQPQQQSFQYQPPAQSNPWQSMYFR